MKLSRREILNSPRHQFGTAYVPEIVLFVEVGNVYVCTCVSQEIKQRFLSRVDLYLVLDT